MDDLNPETIMLKRELAKAKQLIRSIESLALTPTELHHNPNPSPALSKKLQKHTALEAEVTLLSEEVLFREVGLKTHMVIRAANEEGVEKHMLLERISLFDSGLGANCQLEWDLTGPKIKQDGSIATQIDFCMVPGRISIARRSNDGSWQKLTRTNPRTGIRA
jgi:hypothetical protein